MTDLKLTPTTNDLKKNGMDSPAPPQMFNGGYLLQQAPIAAGNAGVTSPIAQDMSGLQALIGGPFQNQQAAPQIAPQPLRIAIIGTAPSSRGLAPVNDPSWKIWVCSAGNMNLIPRVDAWFEIHSNLLWPENVSFGKPYIDWLNQQAFPVFMQDNSLVARAMPFPKDELVKEFGRYFFTSSFAWMMAMAIKSGATEIGLWGVDMASKDEYILQRSGGHFFIQEAIKRGIKITLPPESDLLQPPPLYGFDDSTRFLRKIMTRKKELQDRLGPMEQQHSQLSGSITYLKGALEDIDYIVSIWGGAQSPPDNIA